jgi:murein DD-endopeptidase MepM/ murein hydrolase activator NlpD
MTGFKGTRWIKDLVERFKIKREGLTDIDSDRLKSSTMTTTTLTVIKQNKWTLLVGAGALTIAGAIVLAGNHYVTDHMVDIYHVKVDGQEIGIVSNAKLIEDYKASQKLEISKKFPNVHMDLRTDAITYEPERAFNLKPDDQAVLAELSKKIVPQALGTQLKVDGKVVAIVKDQDTADQILEKVKAPFTSKTKDSSKVAVLAANAAQDIANAPSELDHAEFMQKVETDEVSINPQEVTDPANVVKMLQTGSMQPTKYKVAEGDCVSCIAKKFGITTQTIYQNNPTVQNDKLKIGQELDLTVLQPIVSVKTVERVVQDQEIQYDTDYVTDASLRVGVVQPILAGKNGLKKVTFQLTKVNGQLSEEQLIQEDVITPPIAAKAKKGTKVVLGEGSGKFAWPVFSPSISSPFGYRWGKLHKGVDITGNKSILAADNGKVIETGYKDDYGNYIIINHLNGYETLYGHLSKIDTSVGKIVEKGEKIGVMGSTGDSTGVHLHFEIHKSGGLENPLKYLNR